MTSGTRRRAAAVATRSVTPTENDVPIASASVIVSHASSTASHS